ncbi:hypothetical protein SYK_06980 [Pseudodesulfovibrio nedwellii]|uniref:YgiT-type zinc finger protein n=1 Tax=Pseudodesulfovibrio nedwellii TaxID=2973072 RepID=A0ABM8AXV7_9BACT|nr:hypothetical protein [Pseudodesulfovibrio nedwellii]BDQ35900.1 hypothetical protein SYK_02600 [Pseudodesulfovibrio nedwellii]BDQ36338.1 hypothetical protein SYK_06980 [Pseudodesulfovibrio nedwellii]
MEKTCGLCEQFEGLPGTTGLGKCDALEDEIELKHSVKVTVFVHETTKCAKCEHFDGNDEYRDMLNAELAHDETMGRTATGHPHKSAA